MKAVSGQDGSVDGGDQVATKEIQLPDGDNEMHSSNSAASPLSSPCQHPKSHVETTPLDDIFTMKGIEHLQAVSAEFNRTLDEREQRNQSSIEHDTGNTHQQPELSQSTLEMRIRLLPILNMLSVQLLCLLALGTYNEILDLCAATKPLKSTRKCSERSRCFHYVLTMFDHAKSALGSRIFLSPSLCFGEVHNVNDIPECSAILRKANLATFIISTFAKSDIGFAELHDHFFDSLLPSNNQVSPVHYALLLEFLTQACISTSSDQQDTNEPEAFTYLFPQDISSWLLSSVPGLKQMTSVEEEFLQRYQKRRRRLLEVGSSSWKKLFPWQLYLRSLSEYLVTNFNDLAPGNDLCQFSSRSEIPVSLESIINSSDSLARGFQQQTRQLVPPTTPGATTPHILANIKITNRRLWTIEEEVALLHGLETVNGPHWSQIIEMYGPNGSISEVLKDRSQVQLKDKARNLKLFFLRSEIPLPKALQSVSGDLKPSNKRETGANAMDESKQNHLAALIEAMNKRPAQETEPFVDGERASQKTSSNAIKHGKGNNKSGQESSPPLPDGLPDGSVNVADKTDYEKINDTSSHHSLGAAAAAIGVGDDDNNDNASNNNSNSNEERPDGIMEGDDGSHQHETTLDNNLVAQLAADPEALARALSGFDQATLERLIQESVSNNVEAEE